MEYQDFESAMKALEEVVAKLEAGDLPLEKALALFEEGVQISRFCNTKLAAAERKVEILVKNEQGDMETAEYSSDERM